MPAPHQNEKPTYGSVSVLVGAGGFEPPKSKTTDLQSAPFGHSGTLPYLVLRLPAKMELVDGRKIKNLAVLVAYATHPLRFQVH